MNASAMLTWRVTFKYVGPQDFINRHGSPMLTVSGIMAQDARTAVDVARTMQHVQFDWEVEDVRRNGV